MERSEWMDILALVKNSLDVSEIKVDPETNNFQVDYVPRKFGQIDQNVIEAAVRLKERYGGYVRALCVGNESAKDNFRDLLAMGIDEGILLIDSLAYCREAKAIIRLLEAGIKRIGKVDLILCGFASDDEYTFQVGPRLSERLNLPLLAYVRQIELLNSEKIKATLDKGTRIQTVISSIPAMITIAEEAFPPRRITLMDAIKAKKKTLSLWTMEDLGISEESLSENTFSTLMVKGFVVNRKRHILKGENVGTLADALIEHLIKEKVLSRGE